MFLRLGLGIMVISLLTGCTTLSKPVTMTSDPLNGRVDRIEQRIEKRDRDIAQLKFMVEEMAGDVARLTESVTPQQVSQTKAKSSVSGITKARHQQILRVPVTPQEVQMALKNSGYYEGKIDGNLGSGSQQAIKIFQKDHDLKSDGIIGKKTWGELKNYL